MIQLRLIYATVYLLKMVKKYFNLKKLRSGVRLHATDCQINRTSHARVATVSDNRHRLDLPITFKVITCYEKKRSRQKSLFSKNGEMKFKRSIGRLQKKTLK